MKNILFAAAAVTGAVLFCTADNAEAGTYHGVRQSVPVRSQNYGYVQHGNHLHIVRPQPPRYNYRPAPRYRANYLPVRTYTPVYNSNHSHADHHRNSNSRNRGYGGSVRPATQYFGLNIFR